MPTCQLYESWSQFSATHSFFETLTCAMQKAPIAPESAGASLWLIIALPLLGALISGVFGKTLGRANTHLVACGSVLGSFLLSLLVFWTIADGTISVDPGFGFERLRYAVTADYGVWFHAGDFTVRFGLLADHLSGTMLLVITGVGFLIHLYSTEYMSHDQGYWRFFAYLNLFVAMMLTLVLADSLVLLFVGWEGVGLCSYLLIGFWYDDAAKAFAGRKAFITNRIGDFGFLLGSFLMVLVLGAFMTQATNENFAGRGGALAASQFKAGTPAKGQLSFSALEAFANAMPTKAGAPRSGVTLETPVEQGPLKGYTFGGVLTVALLLFMLGAAGKSAQFPLYVWLPDAMAGPTPVSALIHAATMVTSGLYLFCRISYLLVLSPTAMAVIAVVGGLTAFLAAAIAFAQDDLKKVLAYSTVSQLGFMFMGIGSGIFWAGFLHVVTHAFFKACLFLGAGSVMHGNADEGNFKKLGGLKDQMPYTHWTFFVGTMAITGIIPMSGFFSKDSILHGLHVSVIKEHPGVLHTVWLLGLLTAACTAFYMMRLYLLAFHGKRAADARVPEEQVHESGPNMVGPLVILATLSFVAAVHGIPFMSNPADPSLPKQTVMENFLSPVFRSADRINELTGFVSHEAHHGLPWSAWGVAWAIALVAGGLAFFLYRPDGAFRPGRPFPQLLEPLRVAARNKFWVDEAYELLVIRPIKFVSFISFKVVDQVVIDTVAVRGTAWVTARAGSLLRYFQTGDAQSYAAVMAVAIAVGLVWALLKVLP